MPLCASRLKVEYGYEIGCLLYAPSLSLCVLGLRKHVQPIAHATAVGGQCQIPNAGHLPHKIRCSFLQCLHRHLPALLIAVTCLSVTWSVSVKAANSKTH